jgi:alpha-L-fucosidase 2
LEYIEGEIKSGENSITYDQEGWGGFKYQIHVEWKQKKNVISGCWSISSQYPEWKERPAAREVVARSIEKGFWKSFSNHEKWWENYWSCSSIQIPDTTLLKQYYQDMYKFGSAARQGTPPISLQAVWTADNGKIPPWKGDFYHDLNTQLSYWPAYTGNHLILEKGFLDWLWRHRKTFKDYTAAYFETEGLNVPGVTTLTGEPMGGWIQYSFGPTVSAWLGQHFYLHWCYSMDKEFLRERAYPWIKSVALHLEQLSVKDPKTGLRKLPISSSPEFYNNSRKAWFGEITNFDLALIRWTFEKAALMADQLGLAEESGKWQNILEEWPGFAIDDKEGLMIAPGHPYHQSHRHFSHLMAFHPLGLINWYDSQRERIIIENTINNLEKQGTDWWTGYSFAWLGNLYARAQQGEKAAAALGTFAECFTLKNSFHVNGDQSGTGKSNFTYRPFTLEGNFAYAAGIQEMLLQSYDGLVRIFPAVPESWENVSFKKLRARGAFLISAQKKKGKTKFVQIFSEKGGDLILEYPFPVEDMLIKGDSNYELLDNSVRFNMGQNTGVLIMNTKTIDQ